MTDCENCELFRLVWNTTRTWGKTGGNDNTFSFFNYFFLFRLKSALICSCWWGLVKYLSLMRSCSSLVCDSARTCHHKPRKLLQVVPTCTMWRGGICPKSCPELRRGILIRIFLYQENNLYRQYACVHHANIWKVNTSLFGTRIQTWK